MHSFTELVDRCAAFTLSSLEEANGRTIDSLQTSGATSLVKTLQMIELQKAVLAVGMFSLFEAALQDGLGCRNGFEAAERIFDRHTCYRWVSFRSAPTVSDVDAWVRTGGADEVSGSAAPRAIDAQGEQA